MEQAAAEDPILTRQKALPQLGLRPEASASEIDAAYNTAVAEIELMTRNARSEALSASYRRARDQIERAYQVLRTATIAPAAGEQPSAHSSRAGANGGPLVMRQVPSEISLELRDQRVQVPDESGSAPADSVDGRSDRLPASGLNHTSASAARLSDEIASTRQEAAKVRDETAAARQELAELRAQSQAVAQEVARLRDRLQSLSDEAEVLRQSIGQLGTQSARELDGLSDARKRADGLLISAQRNESEIATAAMHAEAYRDSAMYAAQAAERVLRALSAEAADS